ncbi:MAG: HlyD family secretion protein [Lautropia sp.]
MSTAAQPPEGGAIALGEMSAQRAEGGPTRAEGGPATPPKSGGRGWRIGLALIVLLAVAIALGHWLYLRWTHVYVNDSRIAANLVTLGSEVTGRIIAIPVVAGDRVAAGDLLVAIDSRQARLKLAELDAEIAGVAAQQDQLRAQQAMVRRQVASRLEAGRTQVKGAEAEHRATQAGLEAARSDHQRLTVLRRSGTVSAQHLEEGLARFLTSQQQALRASAGIDSARAALAVIEAEADEVTVLARRIAALDAQRAALAARRAQQQMDIEDREIRAAFDGVVDATFVEVGEHVAQGTRLVLYHDPKSVWVDANVKETDFRRLRIGAPVTIAVDAYPGRPFRGEVVRLGHAATSEFALLPSPNPSGNFTKVTQRLPLRVAVEQDAGLLRPGMMVELAIETESIARSPAAEPGPFRGSRAGLSTERAGGAAAGSGRDD